MDILSKHAVRVQLYMNQVTAVKILRKIFNVQPQYAVVQLCVVKPTLIIVACRLHYVW